MKIRLLVTGGTIDKCYNMHNGALRFVDTHVPAMLAAGRCRADIALETLMLIDSLDMVDEDRGRIAARCHDCAESRLVITHGTDTMAETARLLAERITGKTIVLTGAMIPYVFSDSDALFNLGVAIGAVQALPVGIYIAMNGRIFDAHDVIKNREEGIFVSASAAT